VTEPVNARLPAFYIYASARQRRRQAHVEAADRAARDAAPDPIAREHAGRAATRSAVAAFDASEPELTFEQWRDAA
jgi:hypothetical protein